ncbi:MAG: tRNA pseudouridine(55) synthase TruB [Clostridia bacterium]|jgi:tRNA pseudouridine55 synthase|nr:tRNA pseudouridine(55) synthase TruB [Clostridia bacterium]
MVINGIVLINKARGVSSNSVVGKVKRITGADKAGHFGTLDVLGEGLLPIALGKGTKLFDFFLNKDKVYETVYKFGETTATLDLEGEITQRNDVVVTLEDLENVCKSFVGKMAQMPPQYSAKKVNGKRAYELAREGKAVELKPKEIEIYSIKVLKELSENTFQLEIWCSSGTFIRSICRDIAAKLNTYGVMQSILRTKCGIFELKDAKTIEELEKGNIDIISLDKIFDYPQFKFNEEDTKKLLNGMTINHKGQNKDEEINKEETILCYGNNDLFLGLGKIVDNKLKLDIRLI